jgi:D-alanyl-D-alanine carboxypeptidase/D-alanyl-D-alanine-endopeptidase (penicillin-binding protein 4)
VRNRPRTVTWRAVALAGALLTTAPAWSVDSTSLDPSVPAPPEVPSFQAGSPDLDRVGRALADAVPRGLATPALGSRVTAVVAPLTGSGAGFATGPTTFRPASTMKLLTAAAALETFGPAHTFSTTVALEPAGTVSSPRRSGVRTVVLTGGGDPLLASKPQPMSYPQRADVRTLAAKVAVALAEQGVRRVRVRFDSTLFTGPSGSPQWRTDYLREDIVAPITALWVDGGRPASGFGRVEDPAAAAAIAFRRELIRAGVRVAGAPMTGVASSASDEVARVDSAPLAAIVEHLLQVSDNETSEVVAHQVGLAVVGEGSFTGGARGVIEVLGRLGVPLDGVAIYDGSGLARANRLSSQALVALLRLAADPGTPHLRPVLTGLPVAAFTGSLANRFGDGAPAGRGLVRAKTGTLTGVHGLAGLVTDRDGRTYAFVLVADRVAVRRSLAARTTLDRLAAALADCRCGGK